MVRDARKAILDSAAEVFNTFGYFKTTVEDIAAKAHKAKASIYYYFGSKAEIYEAVLSRKLDEARVTLTPYTSIPEPDSYDKLDEKEKEEFCKQVMVNLKSYLLERMRILSEIRRFVISDPGNFRSYVDDSASSIINKVRKHFDDWEREYFKRICIFAQTTKLFKSSIKPELFANMSVMLLKGVELQMLTSQDYEDAFAIYTEMVNFITRT